MHCLSVFVTSWPLGCIMTVIWHQHHFPLSRRLEGTIVISKSSLGQCSSNYRNTETTFLLSNWPSGHLCVAQYASQVPVDKVQVVQKSCQNELASESDTSLDTSCDDVEMQSKELQLHLGDWVLVKYGKTVNPGEVKTMGENDGHMSVMVSSWSNYKWPSKEDSIFYTLENVIGEVTPPIPTSARGQFQFTDNW